MIRHQDHDHSCCDAGAVSVRAVSESQLPDRRPPRLTTAQRGQIRFVLEIVDRLAADEGFEPGELRSERTGEPLGPELERMRAELEQYEFEADADDGPSLGA